MKKLLMSCTTIAGTALMLLLSASANAQATRTWVSGVGDDANPCSRTAPCKTFAGAISKTAINGEINCLDPGGFGAVTITKSITIDCHEVYASILAAERTGSSSVSHPAPAIHCRPCACAISTSTALDPRPRAASSAFASSGPRGLHRRRPGERFHAARNQRPAHRRRPAAYPQHDAAQQPRGRNPGVAGVRLDPDRRGHGPRHVGGQQRGHGIQQRRACADQQQHLVEQYRRGRRVHVIDWIDDGQHQPQHGQQQRRRCHGDERHVDAPVLGYRHCFQWHGLQRRDAYLRQQPHHRQS